MGHDIRQLVNPELLPIASAEVVSERVLIERNATDLRQLLRELLVEQIHDEVLHESFHVPIESTLKLVDVTEHQAALSKESFHDVGAVGPFVHGILLDQPVRVAVDACICKVLMVSCGLSSLCMTLCAKYIRNVSEEIPLRSHVVAVLLAERFAFSSLLFMIFLLLVEVSSEVRLVVIADISARCALGRVELQRGHAHTCIFQVGNCLRTQREHIHDHLDDQPLLQHVAELGVSGAAVVAIRQSRY